MRILALLVAAAALLAAVATAHEHHGEAPTCAGGGGRVLAEFRPGEVTLDGHPADWDSVEASEFALLPALDPDEDKAYAGGKVSVKAVHDGVNIFFMLKVDGDYTYTKGENEKCPSVALMFQIGEKATYHNMGGCKDMPGSCTSKSCRGQEVDIMHFSVGNAIPGRLYGGNNIDNADGNGGDRFGHLVDLYAWNPHCRYLDGIVPKENNSNAQNDWHGAWWHSSLTYHSGFVDDDSPYGKQDEKGTYYFEFSRPLRTMDRFQQVELSKKLGRWGKDRPHGISLRRAQPEPSQERSRKPIPLIHGDAAPCGLGLNPCFEAQPTTRECPFFYPT